MSEALTLTGVVLLAQPVHEYDKRLVILTAERGKITAFARGARRLKSPLLASANPFVFGRFSVYEGRNAYTLVSCQPEHFFEDLPRKMPGIYYGFYFLELASYFGREEVEARSTVNLLFVALRAILKENMPLELVRCVYELRLLWENGLYAPPGEQGALDESAWFALCFVCRSEPGKLFSFRLSDAAMRDFSREVKKAVKREVDIPLKSLELID
ncbi:MAG: DNA repair protein RecO [Lachnospiraceae bacterium]|nr:DNA repair protein RecO [Lachnospiraceae bacterium]